MADSKPLVSIGMPVYNGEKYIHQALDSLLAQDYENFELIISDNASTDGTAEICQEYLAKDKRIRYYRNERNMGAVWNFNRVVQLSRGKYFMWAADHDLWHAAFISRCVTILEEDQSVVLAYPRTIYIDSDGTPLQLTPDQIDTRDMSAVERYLYVMWNLSWCNMVYGVFRRDVLVRTKIRNVWGADHALLAELALKGAFAQISEPLFYRRKNRPDEDPETYKKRVLYYLDPTSAAKKNTLAFENLWRQLRNAHLRILFGAPVSCFDKIRLTLETIKCFEHRFGVHYPGVGFMKRIIRGFIPRQWRPKFRQLLNALSRSNQ